MFMIDGEQLVSILQQSKVSFWMKIKKPKQRFAAWASVQRDVQFVHSK